MKKLLTLLLTLTSTSAFAYDSLDLTMEKIEQSRDEIVACLKDVKSDDTINDLRKALENVVFKHGSTGTALMFVNYCPQQGGYANRTINVDLPKMGLLIEMYALIGFEKTAYDAIYEAIIHEGLHLVKHCEHSSALASDIARISALCGYQYFRSMINPQTESLEVRKAVEDLQKSGDQAKLQKAAEIARAMFN